MFLHCLQSNNDFKKRSPTIQCLTITCVVHSHGMSHQNQCMHLFAAGVYSLEWESLGQCLYTTSFEQSAVSVSLSPASRHLLVGLAPRRVTLLPFNRRTMAQIFRLGGGQTVGTRGELCHIRDIEHDQEQSYMSLNCIRWAPGPGQGLVYGTNTGKLKVLR
jgi:activator-of-BECN1-regulated-autophagy protein 1